MPRATWIGATVAESDATVVVDRSENKDAAWVYRAPKPEAANIKSHLAFWKGVEVTG